MTFAELQSELLAFGWEDWTDTAGTARVKRLINEAYRSICSTEPWPFLYATASGNSPLTIADVRQVRTVKDSTNGRELKFRSEEWLRSYFSDLTASGSPQYWYWNTTGQVAVLPVQTVVLQVPYLKRPTLLSAAGDTPLLPDEWHTLIIKGAALKANLYKDNTGADGAKLLRQEYDRELAEMRDALFPRQSEPSYVIA